MSNIENKNGTPNVSLEEKLAAALATIDDLRETVNNLIKAPVPAASPVVIQAPSDDIHLVYLSDALGHIEASNVSIDCTRYGESFALSRGQLDAVVGKYRKWFEEGILALGNTERDIKCAAEKGVKTAAEYVLSADKLNKLGSMTPVQIEKLWEACENNEQKLSIVTFFKKNFYAGNPGFRVREKVECLNRLTNNGFSSEVREISGLSIKIEPTDFLK